MSSFFGFTLIFHFPTNPSLGTLRSSPPCPLPAAPSCGSRQHYGNLWDLDYTGSQPSPSQDNIWACLSLKSITQILFYIRQSGRTNRLRRSLLFATPGREDLQYNNYLPFLSWKSTGPQHHVVKICLLLLLFLHQVPIYERPSSWIHHFSNHCGHTWGSKKQIRSYQPRAHCLDQHCPMELSAMMGMYNLCPVQ